MMRIPVIRRSLKWGDVRKDAQELARLCGGDSKQILQELQAERAKALIDPKERRRILRLVTARMKRNPVSIDIPRLTRDEMHERRP